MSRRGAQLGLLALSAVVIAACGEAERPVTSPLGDGELPAAVTAADVVGVAVTGDAGAYTFAVTVGSPDTGCEQYADWWEVVSEDGTLIYRRVLLHSHPTEQPFTRSGDAMAITAADVVIVRAHMNNGGYGGTALRGSVGGGFRAERLALNFAPELASRPPLPEGCDG